jgi:membrane associated rhomboid family serine protease
VIYPHSRVYTFIPIGFFARLRLVPAVVVLSLWFILQLFSGVGSLSFGDRGGTAYWAHIGGFVFGLLVGYLFKKRGRAPQPAPPTWN